jgi:hypothetical protein
MELSLCEECLASLGRWIDRKTRSAKPAGSEATDEGYANVGRSRHWGRRGLARRSPYAVALDRGVTALRVQIYLAVGAIVLTASGLIGLVVYLLVRM